MTQAGARIWWLLRYAIWRGWWPKLKDIPRPGYCMCCGMWAWLTNEAPAYSAHDGAYLCEECADENARETELAWRDYYSSVL